MTGSTKVWRAPLAGLAAVAMLATMGVAAGTANAADEAPKFKLSFNLNGHAANGESTPGDITLGDSTHSNYKVGVWNVNAPKAESGWVFTGWYTSAKLGEGERFNTQAPVLEDTTLYAHWAKSGDTATVSFNTKATLAYPDLNQNGTPNEGRDRSFTVAKGDKLSAWNAPTDGKKDDGKLLTGFTDKDGKADFDFTQAVSGKTLTAYAASVPSTQITLDGGSSYVVSGTKDAAQRSGLARTKIYEVAQDNPGELPAAGKWVANKFQLVSNWTYKGNKPGVVSELGNADQYNTKTYAWDGTLPVNGQGDTVEKLTLSPADPSKEFTVDENTKVASEGTALTAEEIATGHVIKFQYDAPSGQNVTIDDPANPVLVADGDTATLPEPNLYDGKLVFDGWYDGTTRYYGESFDEDVKTVKGSFTFGNVQFTVTFDPDYTGSTPTEVKTAKGATVAKPADPTRDGYVFAGWALDGDKDVTAQGNKPAYFAPVYRTDADFRGVQVNGALKFKALWLTASQSELKGLLDETGAAYDQDTQAWTDFKNKQTEVKTKAAYYQDVASSVKALSHVSEAAAKDYVKQLSDLKGKLTATNGQFIDVFTGNNGTVATPHSADINFVAKKGISTGYGDGTFKPTGSMFRQDYAAFLYRLAGSPEYTPAASDNIFTDVTPATPHYKEILWAAKQGIIKGFADGTFRGLALVNRQDAAAFLYRAAGSPEFDASKAAKTFTDVNESTPHYKEVLWAANTVVNQDYDGDGTTDNETAIIQGFNTGTFDGYATLLRQDGAAFLARTYFYINK